MLNQNMQGSAFCTTIGLLTGTGAETVYDTTVVITFCIDGRAYTKAAVTDGVTPVVDGNTGAAFLPVLPDKACVLLWCLNAGGTVKLCQGPIESVDGDTDVIKNACQFPPVPENYVPFAYTLFQTAGTSLAAGLLPGTSNWNATGLTATHRNLLTLPSKPVTA